jgi:Na+(H+)/acetate symporter ActP
VTAIYTVVGGLRAVVVTETIQTGILLFGTVLITVLAVRELPKHGVHSWEDLNRKIDVQHSAESLDRAAGILTGVASLLNADNSVEGTATDRATAAADLMWSDALELLESGKLGFVSAVLNRRGHETIAAVFEEPSRWEAISLSNPKNLSIAAAALKQEREKIQQIGDMNRYLKTAESMTTQRLSMLRAEGPYYWLAILLGYPILGIWYWCSDQTIV